jgi:hypothetical protein
MFKIDRFFIVIIIFNYFYRIEGQTIKLIQIMIKIQV